nr:MAG TPA: hypothetical protein [Caudoviricetes sp.]
MIFNIDSAARGRKFSSLPSGPRLFPKERREIVEGEKVFCSTG